MFNIQNNNICLIPKTVRNESGTKKRIWNQETNLDPRNESGTKKRIWNQEKKFVSGKNKLSTSAPDLHH